MPGPFFCLRFLSRSLSWHLANFPCHPLQHLSNQPLHSILSIYENHPLDYDITKLKHKTICCQIKGRNLLKIPETLNLLSRRWWLLHWRFSLSINLQSTFTSFVFHLESFPLYVVVALVHILSYFVCWIFGIDGFTEPEFVCMKV